MLTGTGAQPPAHRTQTHAHTHTNKHTHTHTRLLLNAPQIDCTAAEADPSKLCVVVEVKGKTSTSPPAGGALDTSDTCPFKKCRLNSDCPGDECTCQDVQRPTYDKYW